MAPVASLSWNVEAVGDSEKRAEVTQENRPQRLSGTTQTLSIPSKHAVCRHISKQKPSRALRRRVLELRRSILELGRLESRGEVKVRMKDVLLRREVGIEKS